MAHRADQEVTMRERHHLVRNDQENLDASPVLRADICEFRHIGAIPEFRGPSRCGFRDRGRTGNPTGHNFTIGKFPKYVGGGMKSACPADGIPLEAEFSPPPPTKVAKKITRPKYFGR